MPRPDPAICNAINDALDQAGFDLDGKLSVLASMVVGLINHMIDNPTQRQIHVRVFCETIRNNCDIETEH